MKSKVHTPVTKRLRRLGIHTVVKADKYIARRPYPPGQHGQSRRSKQSDYGIQLQEKQRAKFIYGLRERQFRKLFEEAHKKIGTTGERLLQLLEMRLDNIVYRSGIASTRRHARQLVNHGHVQVNGKTVTIPSFNCAKDMQVSPVRKDGFKFNVTEPVDWLKINEKKAIVEIAKIPSREEITTELDEQLIVEFYSR